MKRGLTGTLASRASQSSPVRVAGHHELGGVGRGGQGEHAQPHRDHVAGHEDRDRADDRAVGAEQQPAEDEPGEPVGGEDLPGEDQERVHGAEGDEQQAATAQQPARLALVRAGATLAGDHPREAVAVEDREHRERPVVQDEHDDEPRDGVGHRGAVRAHAAEGHPRVDARVGHRDQQQHHAAGQVGGELAFRRRGDNGSGHPTVSSVRSAALRPLAAAAASSAVFSAWPDR